jgi:2'-5' RNA ligase
LVFADGVFCVLEASEVHEMPFKNQHAARQKDPGKYKSFRRKNNEFGKGVDVIYGITSDGKAEVQSIRFKASKFTPDEAREWLKDHGYKTGLEEATGKSLSYISKEQKHTGVMVALMLPHVSQSMAKAMGQLPHTAETVPQKEMHITLKYFGDNNEVDFSLEKLQKTIEKFASIRTKVKVKFTGIDKFLGVEDGTQDAIFVSVDGDDIFSLRGNLIKHLEDNLSIKADDRVFTPHLTLAYVPVGTNINIENDIDEEITFNNISIAWGGQIFNYPFSTNAEKGGRNENMDTDIRKVLSFEEIRDAIYMALDDVLPKPDHSGMVAEGGYYIVKTYFGSFILEYNKDYFVVPYSLNKEGVELADRDEWVEVEHAWVAKVMRSGGNYDLEEIGSKENTSKEAPASSPTSPAPTDSAETEERDEKEWSAEIVQKDNEKQIAYGVVYGPREEVDTQGDLMDADEVEKMAHQYLINKITRTDPANDWQHEHELSLEDAVPVESYLSPVDFELGGYEIRKGDWIMATYIPNKELWNEIKKGNIKAYSIKGKGRRVPVEG